MEQNIKHQLLSNHDERVRKFKGKTEFTITPIDYSTPETIKATTEKREADKRERHFYQRMLRAYLRGVDQFNFGFRYDLGQRIPITHKVLFAWE